MDEIRKMLQDSKKSMNKLIELLLTAADDRGLDLERETLINEFKTVGVFVTVADNKIKDTEVGYYNYLFDCSLTEQEMAETAGIIGNTYGQDVVNLQMPGWKLCKTLDREKGTYEVTDLYINTVDFILQLFASVDGKVALRERAIIAGFENSLKKDRQ